MSQPSNSNAAELTDKISTSTAIVIGINSMIGVGIISVSTSLANAAGPAGILSFVFSIGVVLALAISLGNAARCIGGSGWSYRYPAYWGGHIVGMISSVCYLVAVIVAMGFLAQEAGRYLSQFIGFFEPSTFTVITMAVLTLLVLAGAEIAALGQYIILGSVLIALAITMGVCWLHASVAYVTPFMPKGARAIFDASPSALFGFLGFETIASLSTLMRDPVRNVARASVISVLAVGIIYVLFVGGVLLAIAPHYFAGAPTLDVILATAFPHVAYLATIVLVGVLFGILGTLHAMIWSLGVLMVDVLQHARSSLLRRLHVQSWWGRKTATIVIAVAMTVMAFFLRGDALVNMTIFFMVPSFALSIAGLLGMPDEWRSGRNSITIVAILGCGVMMYFASHMLCSALAQFFR